MVFLIIFIAWVVGWFVVLLTFIFAKRIPKDSVFALTGSLGQGKTLIGVTVAQKSLKKYRYLYALHLIKKDNGIPKLYSNIPMSIKNGLLLRMMMLFFRRIELDKYESPIVLEYEHLVMVKRVHEYSVIFVDEIGQFAHQYTYDNPFVVQYLADFVRFFRHFVDGRFIFTDQASDNVTKPIRVRVGVVHNLMNFHRFMFHFYKVDVMQFMMSENIQSVQSDQMSSPPYYFGYLPYKWFTFLDWTRLFSTKKYESRCYKPLYDEVLFGDDVRFSLDTLFTKYVIDLPDNAKMKKQYKKDGYITKEDMMQYIKEWQKNVRGQVDKTSEDENDVEDKEKG